MSCTARVVLYALLCGCGGITACSLLLSPAPTLVDGDADGDADADSDGDSDADGDGDGDGDADGDGDGDGDGDADGDADGDGDSDADGDADADQATLCPGGCDDGLHCTIDDCLGGTCQNTISVSFCLIDDFCYADGTVEPDAQCRGCKASIAPTAWTNLDPQLCDDRRGCTINDSCQAGVCRGENACPDDDGYSCTLNECTEEGVCLVRIQDHHCLIDGECHESGVLNPDESCQLCEPMLGPDNGWSWVANGTPCEDEGDVCFDGDCGT